jgi:hypothetical protein
VIAVLAAVYFFAVEQPRYEKKERAEELSKKLTTIDKKSVKFLSIEHAGGERLRFAKEGEEWRMLAPLEDRADKVNINVLINSIADAEIERRLEPGEVSPADVGLDKPAAVVKLQTSGKDTTLTLAVGNHNLTKSHFYARLDTSREILLLPATIRRYAVKGVSDFRDKRVIDFDINDVRKLAISRDGKTMTWMKRPGADWFTIVGKDTIKGDSYGIQSILRKMKALRVTDFVSDDPKDFEKYSHGREHKLTIWTGDDMARKALLCAGGKQGKCYVKRESNDRIVSPDDNIMEVFDKTVDDLRLKKLLAFNRNDLAKIVIALPDTTSEIEKAGKDWAFPNPAMGTIRQYKVSTFLTKLENLKFGEVVDEHFASAKGYGMEKPSCRISLYDHEGKLIDEFVAGELDRSGKERYVTSTSSRLLALADVQMIDQIWKSFKSIRSE